MDQEHVSQYKVGRFYTALIIFQEILRLEVLKAQWYMLQVSPFCINLLKYVVWNKPQGLMNKNRMHSYI